MARNNDRGGSGRRSSKDAGRRIKKKPCALCKDRIEWVDYKDVSMLRKYMSDRGKIRARRVSGNCTQHQRDVAIAIKTARELVLLPYTQRTTTERPGGRGRGRDGFGGRRSRDDERSERPERSGPGGGPRGEPGAPRGEAGAPSAAGGESEAPAANGDEAAVVEAQVVEPVDGAAGDAAAGAESAPAADGAVGETAGADNGEPE
jgi:small subunit ribosomal protein S18